MHELRKLAQNREEISEANMEELKDAAAFIGFPYKCYGVRHSKFGSEEDDNDERLQWASVFCYPDEVRCL
jgi:hypothetical protein